MRSRVDGEATENASSLHIDGDVGVLLCGLGMVTGKSRWSRKSRRSLFAWTVDGWSSRLDLWRAYREGSPVAVCCRIRSYDDLGVEVPISGFGLSTAAVRSEQT